MAASARNAAVRDVFRPTLRQARNDPVNQKPQVRLENTQELQLLCNCCGQPYYPTKSWQDKLEAVFVGTERYAICPVCTQSVSDRIFINPAYRRRCRRQVERLQALYEQAQQKKH